jgi:hypothetical protein
LVILQERKEKLIMNKREERKLKAGFIMTGGLLLASGLHSK